MAPRVLIAAGLAAAAAAFGPPPATFPSPQEPDAPLFSTHAELVVLNVTVTDRKGAYVHNLPANAFKVFEDGRPQAIQFFASQDAPVTVGLLIDSSGSMANARDRVVAAAAAFVSTSNPQDEVFALAFNERVRAALPSSAPFTGDAATMGAALADAIRPRGRTALLDAILAGLEYAARGRHPRKVLVVVSDGGDNASTATFDEVVGRTQASNTAIYTIAIVDPLEREADPKRLRHIAESTGGESFRPQRLSEVAGTLDHVSRDIRNAYTIGYAPAETAEDGRVRRLQVSVAAPGYGTLSVRTRHGYVLDGG